MPSGRRRLVTGRKRTAAERCNRDGNTCPDRARSRTGTWLPDPLGWVRSGSAVLMPSLLLLFFSLFINHAEPALERAARHAIAGCEQPTQEVAVNRVAVTVEDEVTFERDVEDVARNVAPSAGSDVVWVGRIGSTALFRQ